MVDQFILGLEGSPGSIAASPVASMVAIFRASYVLLRHMLDQFSHGRVKLAADDGLV